MNCSIAKRNIEAVTDYILAGAKKSSDNKIGIELEYFLIDTTAKKTVGYYGEHGVKWLLEELLQFYTEKICDITGDLIGVHSSEGYVTLEPAAQVEFSAGPFSSIDEAKEAFVCFEKNVAEILKKAGRENFRLVNYGYNPFEKAENLSLIPKKRYEYMDAHFEKIGPWGRKMMRGSAATQISIDFSCEQDCIRKTRIASLLVPIISIICDNTPVFEACPSKHPMMRTEIWNKCDKERCGTVPNIFDDDFSLSNYAEHVMQTSAVLVPCSLQEWKSTEKTFSQVYKDTLMNDKDIEHALSMQFLDVRLKRFIEIRPADSMPLDAALSFAAFIKTVFYEEKCLMEIEDYLCELVKGLNAEEAIDEAKASLMNSGLKGRIYGKSAQSVCEDVISIALRHCSDGKDMLEQLEAKL